MRVKHITSESDGDYEGVEFGMDFINQAMDADPENVLMWNANNKGLTFGWLIYDETYSVLSLREESIYIKFLLSKGFDLFGLIEKGEAIDSTL